MAKELKRSVKNKMLAGVCGGLAEYFDMDPTIVRLLYALGSFFTVGTGVVAYIVMMIVVPEAEKEA